MREIPKKEEDTSGKKPLTQFVAFNGKHCVRKVERYVRTGPFFNASFSFVLWELNVFKGVERINIGGGLDFWVRERTADCFICSFNGGEDTGFEILINLSYYYCT